MREVREEVCEEAEEVCSLRMVVLWAMHALWSVVSGSNLGCLGLLAY